MLLDFLVLYAAVLGATWAIYLATGAVLEHINARNPSRRIQPDRDGTRRRAEEIRHSLKALALSAFLLSAGLFAREQGWVLLAPWELSWWSLALGLAIAFLSFDAWFYFGHRLLHLPGVYRFHALHHRSVAPSAWSNDSSTLVDTAIEHGWYFLAWILLPIPGIVIVGLRVFDQITGMIGHSGFEYFASRTARRPWPFLATTYHDLHHSQFRYNYGNFTSIWDRLLGTMHPDYDRMIERMEAGEAPGVAASRRPLAAEADGAAR
jgi:sterol desaturase/sphingolipid hydroxylase (fatty acid hydroxylase superfamily)